LWCVFGVGVCGVALFVGGEEMMIFVVVLVGERERERERDGKMGDCCCVDDQCAYVFYH
jgi:hypothetical protein